MRDKTAYMRQIKIRLPSGCAILASEDSSVAVIGSNLIPVLERQYRDGNGSFILNPEDFEFLRQNCECIGRELDIELKKYPGSRITLQEDVCSSAKWPFSEFMTVLEFRFRTSVTPVTVPSYTFNMTLVPSEHHLPLVIRDTLIANQSAVPAENKPKGILSKRSLI